MKWRGIMKEFVGLRAKIYDYFIVDGSEDKKAKGTKKCVMKRKLQFRDYKDYKNGVKASQLKNKINQLEKNKINTESLRLNHNEFIKNNKFILKTQQSLKSERHNAFTEKVSKIALSANDDKRIRSIDSIETYAY